MEYGSSSRSGLQASFSVVLAGLFIVLAHASPSWTTVTTCAGLKSAISGGAPAIMIPGGVTIDATCGLPPIAQATQIMGNGKPLPIITGMSKTSIFRFNRSASGKPYSFLISNLDLRNGYYDPSRGGSAGGCITALDNSRASGIISSVSFSGCAGKNGGAISMGIQAGSLTITSCNFSSNTASARDAAQGGAVASAYDITIVGSKFANNIATSQGSASGGAIDAGSGGNKLIVVDTVFVNNSVMSKDKFAVGGAISTGGNISVGSCAFYNNSATAIRDPIAGAGGGAIMSYGSAVLATRSLFSGNVASAPLAYGGAILAAFGGASLKGCSFQKNRAYSADWNPMTAAEIRVIGGAVAVGLYFYTFPVQANFLADNCTFSSNTASSVNGAFGGAVYTNGGVSISSSVFSGNVATASLFAQGGAIGNDGNNRLKLQISGATFQTNSVSSGGQANGGAIYTACPASFFKSNFSGNYAVGSGLITTANGGAVWSSAGVLVAGCSAANNSASATSASGTASGGAFSLTAKPPQTVAFCGISSFSTNFIQNGTAVAKRNDVDTGGVAVTFCPKFPIVLSSTLGNPTVSCSKCG